MGQEGLAGFGLYREKKLFLELNSIHDQEYELLIFDKRLKRICYPNTPIPDVFTPWQDF
jgi:hypothetical protein